MVRKIFLSDLLYFLPLVPKVLFIFVCMTTDTLFYIIQHDYMEEFKEFITIIGSIVATIILPVFGVFYVKDAKKRKAYAEARKAEAENITSYAAGWKELYEKGEDKICELNNKIDQLYAEKNADREIIRDLMDKNSQLELTNQMLEFKKCNKRHCQDREPPSDY